jgi:hypothetical protein
MAAPGVVLIIIPSPLYSDYETRLTLCLSPGDC